MGHLAPLSAGSSWSRFSAWPCDIDPAVSSSEESSASSMQSSARELPSSNARAALGLASEDLAAPCELRLPLASNPDDDDAGGVRCPGT